MASSTQDRLGEIWAEVLRVEKVEPKDDFFALGGNSLTAVRMAGLVFERMGLEPPLARLAEHRTLAGFARCIDEAAEEEGAI